MGQENIPLNVKGLPDEEKIAEKDFSRLPASIRASLTRMAEIKAKRNNGPMKFEFTKEQIADAEKNEAFQNPRQQD
ncbi:MAG: hypothetical protein WAV98_02570 [Minisyncoccia bacterium]